jgi:pilus assembly protein CpaE
LFGDVSVFLNTRGQHNIVDIARLAADPEQFDPEVLATVLVSHESGLKLLVAPANPNDSEPISAATMVNLLIFLKREYEYVIVDTYSSTGYDEVLAAVIQSADRLVIVTTPTMPALKDARIMLTELSSFEGALDKVTIVLNQVDKVSRITPEQITNFLKQPIGVQIPFDFAAVEAVNQGIGLITLDPHRVPSVKPLVDMVQLIRSSAEVGEQQPVAEQPAPRRGGLFGLGG